MSSDFLARVDALAQISQQKLIKILDSIAGNKDFIIEPSLMKPLERITGVTVLRCHGVDKIYKLDKVGQTHTSPACVYLVRSDLITAKRVCDQINSNLSKKSVTKHHVIFVPKLLVSVESLFEEEGLFDKVCFHVLSWELIQLDSKVLSLECPEIFKQLFVENDQSLLTPVAKSLWSLQHVFGPPPLVLYHGKYANIVSGMVSRWNEEKGCPDKPDSDIGCMVIIDRDVDYASALLTPGTYTSLVADVMNVTTGVVEIKKANPETKELAVSMLLTSEDEIYCQIKNRHFSDVFNYLKNKASDLNMEVGKKYNMGIKELQEFVKRDLKKTGDAAKSLGNHINICEQVTNGIGQKFEGLQIAQENILEGVSRREVLTFIEDVMATASDRSLALRLITLLSLTQNGFGHDESNQIKKQFLHAYGHEHLTSFHNLERMGLFSSHPSNLPTSITETPGKLASKMAQVVSLPKRCNFQTVAQKLKLFPDSSKNYNLKDPQDLGYVFGGAYIPIVAQIVNFILKKEMVLGEISKSFPKVQSTWVGKSTDSLVDISPRTVLVYVLGGITYAEISALQWLEKKTGCRIVCAGSSIITGNLLLNAT